MDTRKAGRMGGKRRAEQMTHEQRSASAQVASRAYWDALGPEERSQINKARAAKRRKPK